jgi:type II secretory pathway pseudopilin PulG
MVLSKWYLKIKKEFGQESGMGLVESLVAIAILGVSAVSFITSLSAGAISVKDLNEQAIAQQLLTSQMEELKGVSYDLSGRSYPIIKVPEGYDLTLTVNSSIYTNTNIQKITAVVWHDGSQVSQIENYKVKQ